MDLSIFHPSQIVQMPAVLKQGIVQMLEPDMLKLDEDTQKKVAHVMGGELIFLKMRATYTAPEVMFCIGKDCFALVEKGTDYCDRGKH